MWHSGCWTEIWRVLSAFLVTHANSNPRGAFGASRIVLSVRIPLVSTFGYSESAAHPFLSSHEMIDYGHEFCADTGYDTIGYLDYIGSPPPRSKSLE